VDDEKVVIGRLSARRGRLTINAKPVKPSDWMWELPGMVEIKMQRQDDYPENGVRGGEDVTVLYRGMSAFDYVKGKRLNTATGEAIGAKKAMGERR